MNITLNNRIVQLLPQKALYQPDRRLLVIADIHLGKAQHFRKAGIPMPGSAQDGDYELLQTLFDRINPLDVYFLGDLFHSTHNQDWQSFCLLVGQYPGIRFTLLKGNHDLIDIALFNELRIIVRDYIEDDSFLYTHQPEPAVPEGKINVCGHIHPGILLSGAGRQRLRLPCFYFNENIFVLPAFGKLTGLYLVEQKKTAQVFGVLPGQVRRIQ